ncbi:MAG TPA: hypothetical protein DG761_08320 [Gammaproteobacteria bacterium]|nr:hypothetical protein [Gammaproteobacteria bacterium]|tara:strand:- start:363 stop:569 length:207 start_codon:yes stop_codon:yes gene_type:complete
MSVFENCRAEQNTKGQWCVSSDYWSFPVEDERVAVRLCEVIQAAYRAGGNDLRGKFEALLFPPMEDCG